MQLGIFIVLKEKNITKTATKIFLSKCIHFIDNLSITDYGRV